MKYLIMTGAGMSADSGLPTYRENSKEYNYYKEMTNEHTFKKSPINYTITLRYNSPTNDTKEEK